MTPSPTRPARLARLARPARPARLARLTLDLDGLPERVTAIVAATDGVALSRRFPVRMAVIADPTLARGLLTRPDGVTQGRGIAALRLTLGQGLLTSNGELHRRQRRLVQPAFHPGQLQLYAADAVAAARERSAGWASRPAGRAGSKDPVDLAEEMSSLTLDIVGRTLFGSDLAWAAPQIARAQAELLAVFPRLVRPAGLLAARWPTPIRRRMRDAVGRLDAVVHRVIESRQDDPGRHRDVLSILLAARDEETGASMPRERVRDEVLTLLLAGHETTAVALTWAWFELATHPTLRQWLAEEVAAPGTAQILDAAAWERLPRTRAVIAETLRLHPPAYVMGRVARADLTLGAFRVPRGTVCVISPYALHRDPRSWGPQVLDWRPQRWLSADGGYDEAAPGQPRGAYLPFGAGSRMCIGAAFASMEATLVLATLARDWFADVPPGYDPGLRPSVTLRTRRGVPAVLRPAPRGDQSRVSLR